MKRHLITFLSIILALAANAQASVSYYSSLNGLKQAQLKDALHQIIVNHNSVSSYNALPDYFRKTDVKPGGNEWWDMYSDLTFSFPDFTGLNREHSVPKSWWGGSTTTPAYTDLNHLYPSESSANMAKSNYPLGEVLTATFDNGVSRVGYAVTGQGGGASRVFEPADQYKGDFARTYFYMATCYQTFTWKYNYMFQSNTYPTITPWAIDLLMKWHRDDPVSQKEIDRNEVVYSFQNNRNPFIDHPALAEHIWGNKTSEAFTLDTAPTTGTPELIAPAPGTNLDFGTVACGDDKIMRLQIKGNYLTQPLNLSISGSDKSLWTLSDYSITANLANEPAGYSLLVTYTPTDTGSHTATLTISSTDSIKPTSIALSGKSEVRPALSAIIALPASSITNESYTANWQPAVEDIDYYIVTRTRYVGGIAFTEKLEAEQNNLEITDFNPSHKENYSVQSVKMGYLSPSSNVITVEPGGVTGVASPEQLAAISYPGHIRFICGNPHTDATIYDITGRVVTSMPIITNNMEITLPFGIYFISTDKTRHPIKVIVR